MEKEEKTFIVTANPETVMLSEKNSELKELLLDEETIIIPDGSGIVKCANRIRNTY